MVRKLLAGLLLVMMPAFNGLARQGGENKPSGQPFALRPGQTVYIAAFRRNVGHGHEINDLAFGFGHDLDTEKRVRKEIEARRDFRVVDKLSEAEFVFLVHVDTSTAEGLALPPETYRRYKDRSLDLDALREAAYGRYLVGPYLIPTLGKISNRLIEKLHEQVKKGGNTPRP